MLLDSADLRGLPLFDFAIKQMRLSELSAPQVPERSFDRDLLAWYDETKIPLPWRTSPDPYRVWLSEIMLQQTQVNTVLPYFERFLTRFPTIEVLAEAPQDDVLKLWEGLGYYSRARNLHRCAQRIVTEYGGQFPKTAEELEDLPGIGRYTAGALASIAFGQRVPVLDGNVIRVLSRIDNVTDDVAQKATQKQLWDRAASLVPADRPSDYNQAIMDLGRTICKPRQPACGRCPVSRHCRAYKLGVQENRPVKAPKSPTPHYDVAAGVIWNQARQLLIAKRLENGLLGGLWEFPGGKQESGETLIECLKRELHEELVIEVEVGELLTTVRHAFTHFKITLYAYECRFLSGEPKAIGCAEWRWAALNELDQFAFAHTDRQIIGALRAKANRLF